MERREFISIRVTQVNEKSQIFAGIWLWNALPKGSKSSVKELQYLPKEFHIYQKYFNLPS